MSNTAPTAVTYEGLPVSSGGAHALRGTTRRAAYEAMLSFLGRCTTPVGPVQHSLRLHRGPETPPAPDLERRLESRFGRGRTLVLDADEVDDALDLLDEVHPQPTGPGGITPLWLDVGATCLLLDPETGRPLPGQTDDLFARVGYHNEVHLTLDNRASLRLELCIPTPEDELLARLLPWLQAHLPCRLSPKHWRTWRPSRSHSLRGRVLDVSPFL